MLKKFLKFIKGPDADNQHLSKLDGISETKVPFKKDPFRLIDVICTVYDNADYRAKSDGRTFCNFAASDIAWFYGCKEFVRKTANELADYLYVSDEWTQIELKDAQNLANTGTLIFAALKAIPHGHICVIRPGVEKDSGKWTRVPSCMNIGNDKYTSISNGLNWAFENLPRLHAWKPSL